MISSHHACSVLGTLMVALMHAREILEVPWPAQEREIDGTLLALWAGVKDVRDAIVLVYTLRWQHFMTGFVRIQTDVPRRKCRSSSLQKLLPTLSSTWKCCWLFHCEKKSTTLMQKWSFVIHLVVTVWIQTQLQTASGSLWIHTSYSLPVETEFPYKLNLNLGKKKKKVQPNCFGRSSSLLPPLRCMCISFAIYLCIGIYGYSCSHPIYTHIYSLIDVTGF